jgi:hypothetical protein
MSHVMMLSKLDELDESSELEELLELSPSAKVTNPSFIPDT